MSDYTLQEISRSGSYVWTIYRKGKAVRTYLWDGATFADHPAGSPQYRTYHSTIRTLDRARTYVDDELDLYRENE